MNFQFFLLFTIYVLLILFFCKEKKILIDYKLEKHKRYSSKAKSHFLGGIFLLSFLIYYHTTTYIDYTFLIFATSIFLIGFLSDLKKLNSVSLRFFIQLILIILSVLFLNLEIQTTKVDFLDLYFENKLINTFFVTFCLMVLINGGNFIDGLNGILLKYYISLFIVILLTLNSLNSVDTSLIINLIFLLSILLILNLLGFIYMGDSGAYLISFFTGIYLINLSFNNSSISPYLIIVFLWYPCFELLFSMIRRKIQKIKTYNPDTLHLHQLIHNQVKYKFNSSNYLYTHFITSLIINIYNLTIFIIAIKFVYNSEILIAIILLNILVYIFLYNFLIRIKLK